VQYEAVCCAWLAIDTWMSWPRNLVEHVAEVLFVFFFCLFVHVHV
jgi:hypothetical protein